MTSRLDRLFILLESGSAVITRKAAAKQIGEVQRLHPHELHNLLGRLSVYLNSSSWDTRVAAASAVQAILENVPEWKPVPRPENVAIKGEEKQRNRTNELHENFRLTFENFDLNNVLYKGARLLGSEGTEFDLVEDTDTADIGERLARQRAMLSQKLGLNSGVKIDELFTMEDMREFKIEPRDTGLMPVQEILDSNLTMSSREKNREKRKARRQISNPMNSVTTPSRRSSCSSTEEPEKKRLKLEVKGDEPVPDGTGSWGDAVEWPLENFCSKLLFELFNPKWEKRHGTATALRELLKLHSRGAGKSTFMTEIEMQQNHQLWLEDAALRLLCVLALDRFGDFVSDQVIAPVRETCAQVLGTVVKEMPDIKVLNTIDILLKFVQQKEWEVRHGGLLGMKYIVVVREDLIDKLIPVILDHILIGMKDHCEDVAAVSASILIPIASHLPKLLSSAQVQSMVSLLWDLLLDQDELASACNSFMGLLATLLCNTGLANWIQTESLPNLVPRLWPFLSHNTTSVRKATLQTLRNITLPVLVTTNGIQTTINPVKKWPTELLQEALRHVYQRVLVEHVEEVQELVEKVWFNIVTNADLSTLLHACCPYIGTWLCLAMQPSRLVYDPNMLIFAKTISTSRKGRDALDCSLRVQHKLFLGGTESVPMDVREKNVVRARYKACRLIGLLSRYLVMEQPNVIYATESERPLNMYTRVLLAHIKSRSAIQRVIGGMVVSFWAEYDMKLRPGPIELEQTLKICLTEYVYYDETAVLFTRLLQEAQDFIATLKQHKIQFPQLENSKILTLDQIYLLCTSLTTDLKTNYSLRAKIADVLEERRRSIHNSHQITSNEHNSLTVMIQAIMAGAVINIHALPNEKFAPYVKPLMESIKREENEILQRMAAKNLAKLIDQVINKNPCPNNKIITNLCTMLRCDPEFTPRVSALVTKLSDPPQPDNHNPYIGIISLTNTPAPVRQNGTRGRPSVSTVDAPQLDEIVTQTDDTVKKQYQIQRNGASYALSTICSFFEADLPKKLPIMWELLFTFIQTNVTEQYIDALYNIICPEQDTNTLINSMSLLETVASHIDEALHDQLFGIADKLTLLVRHPLKAIRHLAARCLSTLGQVNASKVMIIVIKEIVPLLSSIECLIKRQGAAETIAFIINKLQFDIVPYVVLLIVPLLGRMSDQDEQVRLISTQSFANLIQLMPLDGITPLTDELNTRKMKDKEFLEYLFSPKSIPDFHVPVTIKAELRSYQQSGVNWLWFLNKYKLHGILCDDMGLGKTLQAICILAGDHYHRAAEKDTDLPSIVICPPTLTGHWVYEITKFVDAEYLRPLHYTGLPLERSRLKLKIRSHNLVVASYDIVRKDIDFFGSVHWNYCILDEGHIIKNGKTKSSKAIKQLIANHRLILSGTPIQNNVLDLWSLFDFLMPGFLGTEKQFIAKFSRPILASRDPKSSAKDQEGGALAMEALHRQVLPFLLRRVKEDVLTDLPPKITQDLLCELSPLQRRLYEDFSKVHLNSDIRNCLENMEGASLDGAKKTHIFQALRYLQNVCNHPKLVLNQNHPEYQSILSDLQNGSLNDIDHSAKLPALKQLLLDCGIGSCSDEVSVNQHRALIFCQLKAMIDIIENDLLKKHLPSVTYLRLDGSIPASNRHSIVTKFNGDPSIDVLLLTTQVGGLGLNLTGADTVIFVEHDWNPMKDLQAMDRAHRIGQKKVVNVYRLITHNSLEEKIMGLQKFKLLTANTVVSDENASMETMGTDQLLDLFDFGGGDHHKSKARAGPSSVTADARGGSMKQIIETLPDLWEDQQYEEEYDLTQFITELRKKPNLG